ncbi:unnamed protein product [Calypogeia fissa]
MCFGILFQDVVSDLVTIAVYVMPEVEENRRGRSRVFSIVKVLLFRLFSWEFRQEQDTKLFMGLNRWLRAQSSPKGRFRLHCWHSIC